MTIQENFKESIANCMAEIMWWQTELSAYDQEKIADKPGPNSWSIGQVYMHLLLSSNYFFFKHIEECIKGEKAYKGGRKKLLGYLAFLINAFPPFRFKVPQKYTLEPEMPESVQELDTELEKLRTRLRNFSENLPTEINLSYKRSHAAFGRLNALEWMQMMDMHFRHHRRQKDRIDIYLNTQTAT